MAHYSRVSLNQLNQRLIERCGDNQVFWSSNERKNSLNEAIRLWGVLTGQWSRKFQILTVAGQIFYDVPKQVVSIQRAKYDSTTLFQTSLEELDFGNTNWQQAANGTPQLWCPVGQDKFLIWPPANVGHLLNLEGIALSPALTSGGDFIDIGDEELDKILDYAHSYLSFKEGIVELKENLPLLAGFMEGAIQRNQRLLGTSLYKRYMGQDRDMEQRPMRSPEKATGTRG